MVKTNYKEDDKKDMVLALVVRDGSDFALSVNNIPGYLLNELEDAIIKIQKYSVGEINDKEL